MSTTMVRLSAALLLSAWALGACGSRSSSGKGGVQWVKIPGGILTMGTTDADLVWSRPAHRVTVKPFEMTKTLVTNKQFKACVAAGECSAAASYGAQYEGDDQPVVGVNWNQAEAFSAWAGGRLPSESEWEYAARSAGKDQKFPWGDGAATCANAVISGCGNGATAPVCSKTAGNTQQGLCDMAGDAWEWVEDWFHPSYDGAPADGSAWNDAGPGRVFRGGTMDDDAGDARSAIRGYGVPTGRSGGLSFRVVR
jgi:formylglycine-generating enzyme required for sulfatase activity